MCDCERRRGKAGCFSLSEASEHRGPKGAPMEAERWPGPGSPGEGARSLVGGGDGSRAAQVRLGHPRTLNLDSRPVL